MSYVVHLKVSKPETVPNLSKYKLLILSRNLLFATLYYSTAKRNTDTEIMGSVAVRPYTRSTLLNI